MNAPWWELCEGDEYSVELEDGRILVCEGGYGDDCGIPLTTQDVALAARHLHGSFVDGEARVAGTLCELVEVACDDLICGTRSPANDTAARVLERAFALIAAPPPAQKSTPAGADTPAG